MARILLLDAVMLQETMIRSRPPLPRGLLLEMSSQATMIGDLSGVLRAVQDHRFRALQDQRFIATTLFEVARPPSKPPSKPPRKPPGWSSWEAAALGFFGVLA